MESEVALDPLDRKALEHFPGKVVRKDLVTSLKGQHNVPAYVLEYLLGKYCSSADDNVISAGLDQVRACRELVEGTPSASRAFAGQCKHYSIRTEEAYTDWIKRYMYFHDVRHPAETPPGN
jgi:hypothetical protein